MRAFETRVNIKNRILQEAAREWNYRSKSDIDLNAFDPVVDLMIGGCSFELERLSNDISNSRNRIFERLVEILTPDIMTKAQPAYAITHALPTESRHITSPYDLMFYKNIESKKDIFFSPAEKFELFDGRIEMMAFDNCIVSINERLEKDLVMESTYGNYINSGTFYLGISLHSDIRNINNLSFFFDWKNESRVNSFLKYLPLSKWSVNEKPVDIKLGLNYKQHSFDARDEDIFNSMGIDKYIENNILNISRNHFITIKDNAEVHQNKSVYPAGFLEVFNRVDLEGLKDELLWIKVEMPQALRDHVVEMNCLMNCFPIINRKLHEKQHKVKEDVHILPIDLEDGHFLTMDEMTNSNCETYKEVPLKIIDESDHGMFALRSRGVRRFDTREAKHLLSYVMDMIKDESTAFRGLEYNTLESDLGELDTVFRRIEKNFHHSRLEIENTSFLFVRPFPNDNLVYLKYWTTNGEMANRIPHGSPLKLFSNTNINAKSLQLVTSSRGGRNQLQPVDSINAFKEVIMTRGRVVTSEDIKNFCINALGFRNIESIEVKRGAIISKRANEGIIRTIDVHVIRKLNTRLSEEDWNVLCNETEIKLENNSSNVFPIRLLSKQLAV